MVYEQFKSKLIEYAKAKETFKLGVLRYLISEIQKKEIELRPSGEELTDEIVFKVIKKQIKNRKQSIELYAQGNRQDLVDKEQSELDLLIEYAKMFPFELNLETQVPQK